jgi:hypothetical protein
VVKTVATADSFFNQLRGGFSQRASEFLPGLKQFLQTNSLDFDRPKLAELCDLLLAIENNEENRLIVIARLGPILKAAPIDKRPAGLEKFPSILAAKIHERIPYEPKVVQAKLTDVIKKIAGSSTGLDPASVPQLMSFPDAEIRDYLLTLRTEDAIFQSRRLLERIPQCLEAGAAETLMNRLKKILEEIGAMDPLYKFQIGYFIRPNADRSGAQ